MNLITRRVSEKKRGFDVICSMLGNGMNASIQTNKKLEKAGLISVFINNFNFKCAMICTITVV